MEVLILDVMKHIFSNFNYMAICLFAIYLGSACNVNKCEEECKKWGKCNLVNGQCQAGSLTDCLQSNYCKIKGECIFNNGKCLSCRDSRFCGSQGKCSAVDGQCKVRSPRLIKDCS